MNERLQSLLSDIALDVAGLLHRALDLQAALGFASADHDATYIELPSIAPHNQNEGASDWTLLVELNREAMDA